MHIKIGTRGSKLALWQAYHVEELLNKAGASTEIVIIHTKGDKILDRSLSKIGSKGVFTEELEEQLLDGSVDIAVHSAKDLQSDLGNKFEVIAFLEREKINDVLASKKQVKLTDNIVVGTSSTRRIAMLRAFYPQIRIVDMRGNLQTRIAKMESGVCDALLLAYAGVHRMEYHDIIQEVIDEKTFTPAVGQGSVAIETAVNIDSEKRDFVRNACNHPETELCLLTERAFLKTVNGGCSIPVFGTASLNAENEISLNAGIISLDGQKVLRIEENGTEPENLGNLVGERLLAAGGKEILSEIRTEISK
ncbi:hydroxymethylbilane synthase [uncultured Arcticibacterium sp.]|uniref:hydroxymethylbilane synthase n=1 Tax=uncultured Arcticibacterium sp. TaxID=2173042 RepID=UPI0030FC987F